MLKYIFIFIKLLIIDNEKSKHAKNNEHHKKS